MAPDRYALSWRRGETLRQVRAHVRLVLLALVDQRGQGILLGAAVGPPYASEIGLLREVLAPFDALPPCPVVGDRGYDAVDVLERLQQLGAEPALRRYALRHPLRRASQEGWRRWGKRRYRVEGFFGMMKLKMGSVFPLVREDLALRRALAVAVLCNLDRLVAFLCLFSPPKDLSLADLSLDFSNSPSWPRKTSSQPEGRFARRNIRRAWPPDRPVRASGGRRGRTACPGGWRL